MTEMPRLFDLTPYTVRTPRVHLSYQERRVMQYIAKDMTYSQLANKMHIAVGTARFYVASVHRKLGVSSNPGAVARCIRLKLLRTY